MAKEGDWQYKNALIQTGLRVAEWLIHWSLMTRLVVHAMPEAPQSPNSKNRYLAPPGAEEEEVDRSDAGHITL